MQNITQEELVQKIHQLPLRLREIIYAPETFETIELVAKKYNLDVVHIGLLARLTTKLIAGALPPSEFVSSIEEDLGINREIVTAIAQDLNSDIFYKIKEELKGLYAPQAAMEPAKQPEPLKTVQMTTPTTPTVTPPIPPIVPNSAAPITIPAPQPLPQAIPKPSMEESMPKAHIGNIFEEKLGGAFRVKSDTVQYTAPEPSPIPPPLPAQILQAPIMPPVAQAIPPTTVPTPIPAAMPKAMPPPPAPPATQRPTPGTITPPPSDATPKTGDPYREILK